MHAQNHENVRRIFCEDVRERRSIGRGGYHQKNGSKSRKCSLPSDHLTEGAWKKMNGPVTGVTMGAPMEWTTFKDASDRQLLNRLPEAVPISGRRSAAGTNP